MKQALAFGTIFISLWLYSGAAFTYDFSGEILAYEFGWKGIPAADAIVKIRSADCAGPCYKGVIDLQGKKYLDMFWTVRDRFEVVCSKLDYKPRRFTFFQREGAFQLDTEIVLDKPMGLLRSSRVRLDRPKRLANKVAPSATTYCPLSALLYMRSRPLNVGDEESIPVFDGKRTHTLYWKVTSREKIKVPVGEFDAVRVDPKIIRSDYKDKESKVEKVKKIILWLSNDPSHTILRIESEAFVGSIYAELVRKEKI